MDINTNGSFRLEACLYHFKINVKSENVLDFERRNIYGETMCAKRNEAK